MSSSEGRAITRAQAAAVAEATLTGTQVTITDDGSIGTEATRVAARVLGHDPNPDGEAGEDDHDHHAPEDDPAALARRILGR